MLNPDSFLLLPDRQTDTNMARLTYGTTKKKNLLF